MPSSGNCKLNRIYIAVVLVNVFASVGQGQSISSNALTVETFLQQTPIIRRLAYQESELQTLVQVRNSLIVLDGSNILHTTDGGLPGGKFNGIFWRYYPANHLLVQADPAINDIRVRNGNPAAPSMRKSLEYSVGRVVNLGFPEIDRNAGMVWDKEHNRFLVMAVAGRPDLPSEMQPVKMVLQLNYESNCVVSATLSTDASSQTNHWASLTKFSYDKSFYGGHFPSALTRYLSSTSIENIDKEKWDFRIDFRDLELSDGPLAGPDIDPKQVYASMSHSMTVHFWSNNVAYAIGLGGVIPVSSGSDLFSQSMQRELQHHLIFAIAVRILVGLLILFPAAWILIRAWKVKKDRYNQTGK